MTSITPILLLLTGIILPTITGQQLSVEYLDIKLPVPNSYHISLFDGNDGIYLVGGCNSDTDTKILKFSISSETLTEVGTLPERVCSGTLQSDELGHIFIFGGETGVCSGCEVYVFNPTTNTTNTVATLPMSVTHSVSIKYNDSSNTVFLMGGAGQSREILSFNMETMDYSIVSDNRSFYVTGGGSFRAGNKAFIFSAYSDGQALEFDLDTYVLRRVGPSTLPVINGFPSAVWDDNNGYIIGGYSSENFTTNGIIQFNVDTYENTFIPVNTFPVEDGSYFFAAPASVFVPNKNRIYCFGGRSSNSSFTRYHDEIFFIDLTPLNPTPSTTEATSSTTLNPEFFNCNNMTNGLYPHPTDCSLFVGCLNEEMTIFECPFDLLFDPLELICKFPEEVECQTSCIGRPDGTYPHPHDCALYILCRSEFPNIFKCNSPLLFDPVGRHCDFVSCWIEE